MKALISVPERITPDAVALTQIARIKGLAAAGYGKVDQLADQFAGDRAQRYLKAAVGGLDTSTELADKRAIVSAFIEQMRNNSVFYAALADGMVSLPMRTWLELSALDATAWVTAEGKPIPVSGAGFGKLYLETLKAASIVVASNELLTSTRAEANLSKVLRVAIGAAVDSAFLGIAIDSDTTSLTGSAGGNAEAVGEDLRALLDTVQPTTASRLILAIDPALQRAASTMVNAAGGFAFPDLTATGGTLNGIPAMPSAAVGTGKVALIDASRFAGAAETIEIDASGEATIEMLNSALQQDATTGAGAEQVSMFQTDSVAIRAVAHFAAERLEDTASAVITGATWGDAGAES